MGDFNTFTGKKNWNALDVILVEFRLLYPCKSDVMFQVL